MKIRKYFKITNKDKKLIEEFHKQFEKALIYTIDGKQVTQTEFVNYVAEKIKENENHIPHID